jgi:dynactin-6
MASQTRLSLSAAGSAAGNKRSSIARGSVARPPKVDETPFDIATDSVICTEAELVGDVKIDSKTVAHPSVVFRAVGGPIVVGKGNVFEENCVLENAGPDTMTIGDNNIFEVGVFFSGKKAGNGNVFEVKAKVKEGVTVGDGCVVAAACSADVDLRDGSNVSAAGLRVVEAPGATALVAKHTEVVQKHVEALLEILPKTHYLKKSMYTKEDLG